MIPQPATVPIQVDDTATRSQLSSQHERVTLSPPRSPRPPKTSLFCPKTVCPRHVVGFNNEEDLKHHLQAAHIQPLENPLTYTQEQTDAMLGLDSSGQPLRTSTAPAPDDLVPNSLDQSNRQLSSSGTKLPPVQALETPPPLQEPVNNPWAKSTIDPHDLLQTFHPFETGAAGAISDISIHCSNTPDNTLKSSKDGVSKPNSDIVEGVGLDINVDIFDDSWMPFGLAKLTRYLI